MSSTHKHLSKNARENLSKLKTKLRELFQLDRGDLDFGLYRIMALKSAEIEDFLDNHLLPQITEALGEIAESDISSRREELEKATEEAENLGYNPEESSKIKEIQAQIKAAEKDQQKEADVYNHLYNFFSRYYDEGDFMSLRRYKSAGKEAYSIPYNGEEVKLHWANADQYYIKTTENYSSYIFIVKKGKEELRVRFEIIAADNEKDSIKEIDGDKRFFILAKDFLSEEQQPSTKNRDLIIRFEHRPLTEGEKIKYPKNGNNKQKEINKHAEEKIRKKLTDDWLILVRTICPTETNDSRTLLGKHITAYTSKNSFDYFIHKNLGGFLRRELDFYLKSEVISIDNLELTDDSAVFMRNLAQVKAIKKIGSKIIDFLAQLEDFQKKLWLKKKFVLETQYCVTLDKIPESLYTEIVKNKAQCEEWVKLFSINELKGDLVSTAYSRPLKPKFLEENPYLILDTKNFNKEFTDKLLTALSETDPIEKQMNGLLVHGENFQALNLMQERYRKQVKCVYIDPPYNTEASEILYKNNYKHSTWLSLIKNGIYLLQSFLHTKSALSIAIDDFEMPLLIAYLKSAIENYELCPVVVKHHSAGGGGAAISRTHEYNLFLVPEGSEILKGKKRNGIEPRGFMRTGTTANNFRSGRPNSFYALLWNPNNKKIVGCEKPPEINSTYPKNDTNDNLVRIYPLTSDGKERVWRRSYENAQEYIKNQSLKSQNGKNVLHIIHHNGSREPLYSLWNSTKFNASTYGTNLLGKLFNDTSIFSFPKSIYTVQVAIDSITWDEKNSFILDYFAGSGTTGHAVINLNREDNGNRKYLLVEIGHYFQTVLLPRIKKAIYSKEWKDGRPKNNEGEREGISQFFRYIRLESYEDTLDSLIVRPRRDLFKEDNKRFVEDYQLRYALGEETTESPSLLGKDFLDPFNYTLSVVRDGIRRDEQVDLVETFNFLLGLRLYSRRLIDDILTITGVNPKNENCLILWRNLKTMQSSKLDKWFIKHRMNFSENLNLIYVNGDHTLNALKKSTDRWEAITTEPVFRKLMFKETE